MIKDWERKLVGKNVHSVFTWCKDCGMRGCNIPFEDECGNCGSKNTVRYYDKETIKTAIQMIILHIRNDNPEVYDSLSQAYVFLAQFIDDDRAKLAEEGRLILEAENESKTEEELEIANQAVQTINLIKSEMENLMHEIRLIIQKNS